MDSNQGLSLTGNIVRIYRYAFDTLVVTRALHRYYVPQNSLSFKNRKDRDRLRFDWQTSTMLRNTLAVSLAALASV